MRSIDTERMKRVLDRLYPDKGPSRGQKPRQETADRSCILLGREAELQKKLRDVRTRDRECRATVQNVYARSERRARSLRSECFLRRGGQPAMSVQRRAEGVLSTLRSVHSMLETLGEDYEKAAAAEPRRSDMYKRFSSECRADAAAIRRQIDRVMG